MNEDTETNDEEEEISGGVAVAALTVLLVEVFLLAAIMFSSYPITSKMLLAALTVAIVGTGFAWVADGGGRK